MDREMARQHLEQAERHVAEGERHVVRQRELAAELKRDGRDFRLAIEVLHQFEQTPELQVADRDRLCKELNE
jgi:hypothetical protein